MKTIKNLSTSLNISKEAIYKKIKTQLKHELKDHIIKKNNVTYIDDEGEKLIAQSLKREKILVDIQNETENQNQEKDDIQPTIQPYKQVENKVENSEYISFLKEQLAIKDKQIQQLTELNFELVQTFHQEQKLQAQSNLLQLKQDENTSTKVQTDTKQSNKQNNVKKSIFNILFKRKQVENN